MSEHMPDAKVVYDAEHDTLLIKFTGEPSSASDEVAWNVVVDYNASGEPVAIEIDGASRQFRDFIAQAAARLAAKAEA